MKTGRNYLALAAGLCLSLGAAFYLYSTIEFRLSSVVARGTVIRLNAGGHHPEIAFASENVEHHELPVGTTRSFAAGQVVTIRYSADDPRGSAMIDSELDLWRWPFFLVLLAAVFVVTGLKGEPLDNRRNR